MAILDKKIEDFRYEPGMTAAELVERLGKIGYQSIHLKQAADIILKMKKKRAKIFLTFTSNMGSSGLRGLFAQLISMRFMDVVITTVGSIEEDLIKSKYSFYVGSFEADDRALAKEGVNRIGNIFVTNEAYGSFEEMIQPILQKIYDKKKSWTVSEFIHELGSYVTDENSIVCQAAKNSVPIYCPAITDGSMGYQLYLFQQKHPDFIIDPVRDMGKLIFETSEDEEKGVIVLGGGVAKHHAILANLINGGMNYAVYIQTGNPASGTLSSATTEEAKSWGKIREDSDAVTVIGDATILFPLIMTNVLDKLGEANEK